eukprot:TRINITY_DN15570_c0_g2_i1.p1 TRINITY_DN15570_c0_g2~~TRINITY_DN15570_c0_g2_i1.p1  ORF type:complete len:667 (+),score=61.03 TRINITY_DN15570_c0_g2_i1:286-2286(+)
MVYSGAEDGGHHYRGQMRGYGSPCVPPTALRPRNCISPPQQRVSPHRRYKGPPTTQMPPPPPPPGGKDPSWRHSASVSGVPVSSHARGASPAEGVPVHMHNLQPLNPQATAFVPKGPGGAGKLNPAATAFTPSQLPSSTPICTPPTASVSPADSSLTSLTSPSSGGSDEWLTSDGKDGRVVVCTPWYPDGVQKATVQIGDEICAFAALMQLTGPEMDARDRLCETVQSAARRQWPCCTATTYGSYAAGTSSPSSAVDMCIEHCGNIYSSEMYSAFAAVGNIRSMLSDTVETGFCQIDADGTVANVSLHSAASPSPPSRSVSMVRSWISDLSATATVHALLRQVLSQTCNLDVCSGGLSSHALFVMVVSAAKRTNGNDNAALMIEFCRLFGSDFDFSNFSVCVSTPLQVPKVHADDPISVLDPLDESNNLAAGVTRLFQIRAQLQHCLAVLRRWGADIVGCEGPKVSKKQGYKGRTPLSGIISHQKLWARAEAVASANAAIPSGMPPLIGPKFQYTMQEMYDLGAEDICCVPPTGLQDHTDVYQPQQFQRPALPTPSTRPAASPMSLSGRSGHHGTPPLPPATATEETERVFELFSVRMRQAQTTPDDSTVGKVSRPSPGRCDFLGLSDSDAAFGIDSRDSIASDCDEQNDLFKDIDAALANDLNVG